MGLNPRLEVLSIPLVAPLLHPGALEAIKSIYKILSEVLAL